MKESKINQLEQTFASFDDWEGRYRYLIDLGETLPVMDMALKTDQNLVLGCTSRVWLVTQEHDNAVQLIADSDSQITRGLVAILLAVYQGCNRHEIRKIDIEGVFARIGLNQHLSPNRRNGFFAMVEHVKAFGT